MLLNLFSSDLAQNSELTTPLARANTDPVVRR
jgi:hypothetical protein